MEAFSGKQSIYKLLFDNQFEKKTDKSRSFYICKFHVRKVSRVQNVTTIHQKQSKNCFPE